jgi:hypothetical protein
MLSLEPSRIWWAIRRGFPQTSRPLPAGKLGIFQPPLLGRIQPAPTDRRGGGGQRWTATARLEAVITTAAMDEAARSAWCREQGLYPADLDGWKQDAVAGLGEPRAASAAEAREDRRRVKELERELHRKDKALAETAALLVLSKKLAAVFHKDEEA